MRCFVYTNINSKEILSILPDIATYRINKTIGWPYETRGATIGGVWYGPAVTLESNVKRLHVEVYKQENYEPSSTVKQISNERHMSILISSHILAEVENICDRIVIIDKGKIIDEFGIEEVKYKNKSLEDEYFLKTDSFEKEGDNSENY